MNAALLKVDVGKSKVMIDEWAGEPTTVVRAAYAYVGRHTAHSSLCHQLCLVNVIIFGLLPRAYCKETLGGEKGELITINEIDCT